MDEDSIPNTISVDSVTHAQTIPNQLHHATSSVQTEPEYINDSTRSVAATTTRKKINMSLNLLSDTLAREIIFAMRYARASMDQWTKQ